MKCRNMYLVVQYGFNSFEVEANTSMISKYCSLVLHLGKDTRMLTQCDVNIYTVVNKGFTRFPPGF